MAEAPGLLPLMTMVFFMWQLFFDYDEIKSVQWDMTQIISPYELSGSGQQKEWNFFMCY